MFYQQQRKDSCELNWSLSGRGFNREREMNIEISDCGWMEFISINFDSFAATYISRLLHCPFASDKFYVVKPLTDVITAASRLVIKG